MSKKICYGCGVELQDTNSQKPGYVNNVDKEETLLCQRCFKMKNYNEYHSHYMNNENFLKILKDTIKPNNLVVLVVDLFDLNASFNDDLMKIIKKNPILIVATKRDLILKSVKDLKLTKYVYNLAISKGLDIKDVVISSATKKYNIDDIMNGIFDYYNHKDVYICGITNVGKSSLVNAMINSVAKSDYQITISNYPGTTLDSIVIPLDDANLYDTPGLVADSQMIHHIDIKDYKYLENKKEIKAMNYQLNSEQSLFIGGLARIDFVEGEKTGFSTFFNPKLKIHRTKLEKADELFNNHLDDDSFIPKPTNVEKIEDYVTTEFKITQKDKVDIMIDGLGWISFKGNNQTIRILTPKGVKAGIRKALI